MPICPDYDVDIDNNYTNNNPDHKNADTTLQDQTQDRLEPLGWYQRRKYDYNKIHMGNNMHINSYDCDLCGM